MCRTYNTIGSLASLKSHLERNNIYDFKSLKEVMDFQSSFEIAREELTVHHKNLIEEEKNLLTAELANLDTAIKTQRQQTEQILTKEIAKLQQQHKISVNNKPKNLFQKIIKFFRHWNYKKKINNREKKFTSKVENSISHLVEKYQEKNNRYQFITSSTNEAVRQSVQNSLSELERKKTVIDNLNNFIYGALGEQKVVKTLENLSDDFFLINDFSVSFSPAIYNRQENDYIYSVQIDHILIAPSGIFLIETKNWSEKSLKNLSLRSPVEQIRRTNFVLFMLLNNQFSNYRLRLVKHHWGDKKISVKNLIVMTNTKPNAEFQYAKVLTLNELLGYVNYFKPAFSINETKRITEFLLSINEKK